MLGSVGGGGRGVHGLEGGGENIVHLILHDSKRGGEGDEIERCRDEEACDKKLLDSPTIHLFLLLHLLYTLL